MAANAQLVDVNDPQAEQDTPETLAQEAVAQLGENENMDVVGEPERAVAAPSVAPWELALQRLAQLQAESVVVRSRESLDMSTLVTSLAELVAKLADSSAHRNVLARQPTFDGRKGSLEFFLEKVAQFCSEHNCWEKSASVLLNGLSEGVYENAFKCGLTERPSFERLKAFLESSYGDKGST